MNAKNFLAAAAMFAFAGTAFAAETPEAGSNATATATVDTTADASTASAPAAQGDAKEETADFVKNYRTPLAIQLDQYKN